MSNILYQYTNGNTKVSISDDGTKVRSFPDNTPIVVNHPESIDVKITNFCDGKCAYCHEKSTVAGQHGDLNKLYDVLSVLPAGTEIAVGGGDPLSHPDVLTFLNKLKSHGHICNMTVNNKHIARHKDLLLSLLSDKLVMGLGISYSDKEYLSDIEDLVKASSNVVFHLIMGINVVSDVELLYSLARKHNKPCKVLVLGYKNYGFGLNYLLKNKSIEDNKYQWYIKLASFFKSDGLTISFDNLAIEQLKLRRYFTDEAWNKFYMGDDFVYTMYINGVEGEFSPSSTNPNRVSFNDSNLLDYFTKNRRAA